MKSKIIILTVVFAAAGILYAFHPGHLFKKQSVESVGLPASGQSASNRPDQGLVLKNLELKNMKWLPEGGILRIQELKLKILSLNWEGISLEVRNARLSLPDSDPIVIFGTFKDGIIKTNVFASEVGIEEMMKVFFPHVSKRLSGRASQIDFNIQGTLEDLRLQGGCYINNLTHKGFTAQDCPCDFNLKLNRRRTPAQLEGEVIIESGMITGPRTAAVILERSRIFYSGDKTNPALDGQGKAEVENVKIDISLLGTFREPDLHLESFPPQSQERLFVMLATGRSWAGADTLTGQKGIPTELVKDFIDYFAFSGQGNLIADKFGISDIKVNFDKTTKGIGLKKSITNNLKASYELEQKKDAENAPGETIHKVGGEIKINENLSVEAQKGLKPAQTQDTTQPTPSAPYKDEEIRIQFKKKF